MIVIQVFGISDASTEEELQAIAENLHKLCQVAGDEKYYVVFSCDQMKMDLGVEIVALISGVAFDASGEAFGRCVGEVLENHFPEGTLIGVQLLEAKTARDLTKKS